MSTEDRRKDLEAAFDQAVKPFAELIEKGVIAKPSFEQLLPILEGVEDSSKLVEADWDRSKVLISLAMDKVVPRTATTPEEIDQANRKSFAFVGAIIESAIWFSSKLANQDIANICMNIIERHRTGRTEIDDRGMRILDKIIEELFRSDGLDVNLTKRPD